MKYVDYSKREEFQEIKFLKYKKKVDISLGISELYILPVHSCSFGKKNSL